MTFADKHKASFLHFLGLGPLLAITTQASTGLFYGLLTMAITLLGTIALSAASVRDFTLQKLPLVAVIIASIATIAELFLRQNFYEMDRNIGIFIPLLASQSLIYLVCLETSTAPNLKLDLLRCFRVGATYTLSLFALGFARELLGSGNIFGGYESIFNLYEPSFLPLLGEAWRFKILELAPGAFIILGLSIALFNAIRNNKASQYTESRRI
ncbi:MAG: Rnf-Nqr domain containing protein [Pseudohongiellaceae bacterium]|nr:Rnf-Nqr domain containing protein [Pseudohongiellaceae bacterium]